MLLLKGHILAARNAAFVNCAIFFMEIVFPGLLNISSLNATAYLLLKGPNIPTSSGCNLWEYLNLR